MGTQRVTAVVIGSMPVPKYSRLEPLLQGRTVVICADGGILQAEALGLTADYYVGDSDSGGQPPVGLPNWLLPSEKDLTDLEMGVEIALQMDADAIVLLGCSGGRMDHQMANLCLLERIAKMGKVGYLMDEVNLVSCLLPGVYEVENTPPYRYFGILPLDAVLEGLTLQGCKYELERMQVLRGSTLTISNEFLPGEKLKIALESGAALLVRSKPL